MKFTAWLDYPSMSIAIQVVDEGYKCLKYVNNSVVKGATKVCDNPEELKAFLLTLPNPPVEEVKEVILRLGSA